MKQFLRLFSSITTFMTIVFLTLIACKTDTFRGGTSQPITEPITDYNTPIPYTPNPNGDPVTDTNPDTLTKITDFIKDIDLSKLFSSDSDNNTINFSQNNSVWHIGDNNYPGSSCKLGLWLKPIKGSSFNFQFDVLEDNTTLNITVQRICGVDKNSNQIIFKNSYGNQYYTNSLKPGATSLTIPSITLNRGLYIIRVQSDLYTLNTNQTDRDDFVVGNVKVKANKNIQINSVTGED